MMSVAESQSSAISSQNLSDFLRLAAEDDGFRAELQENPSAVMQRFGLQSESLPAQIALPSKEAITAYRASVKNDADTLIDPERLWQGFLG